MKKNIFLLNIGQVVETDSVEMKVVGQVPAGKVLVDGLGVGDVGSVVLRDRKHLSEDGLLVIVVTVDATTGVVIAGPDIVSRGFVYVKEAEALMEEHPSYRDLFPQWAEHGNAMLQFASWVAIRDMGLGANIQHYNPIIDSRVADEFGIPSGYRLIAQMVFGRVVTPAGPKDKLSGDDIVIVAHANNNNEKDM